MKLIDLLRSLLAWPFIAIAWVFYKVYEFIDPYKEWELERFLDFMIIEDEDDDWDCC